MTLLAPLGLLGLLGIAVLVLIYIIRPNYQQKMVSSTFVWKLSLKYKRKSIPINRFRNILIFICQVLILTICATLLSQPFILDEREARTSESIAIIDASASMLVGLQGETRFERAVNEVLDYADRMSSDERISVIVADDDAKIIAQYKTSATEDILQLRSALDELLLPGEDGSERPAGCSYGAADVDGAFRLAEDLLLKNPDAKVTFYTATTYIDRHDVEVVDVSLDDEWNAAILDVKATIDDNNFYVFSIDAACYGKAKEITVYCDVYGANGSSGDGISLQLQETLQFDSAFPEQTITFTSADMSIVFGGEGVYSYDNLRVYIQEDDSLYEDNTFYLYGGKKPTLKVIYESSDPEPYIPSLFFTLREKKPISELWDIAYTEVLVAKEDAFVLEGYDLYIFEHVMPSYLPTDGVSFLIDPSSAPSGADFSVSDRYVTVSSDTMLAPGVEHAITKYIDASLFSVAKYIQVTGQAGYEELLYQAGDPVLLVRNEELFKVAILSLDLNFSNMGVHPQFIMMMINFVNYFFPTTLTQFNFEIGEIAQINARSGYLELSGQGISEKYNEFPYQFKVTRPGTYTLTQTTLSGEYLVENFFAHIPKSESNITKMVDELPVLVYEKNRDYDDLDLLIYFASALVALLFVEWWLQSREYF